MTMLMVPGESLSLSLSLARFLSLSLSLARARLLSFSPARALSLSLSLASLLPPNPPYRSPSRLLPSLSDSIRKVASREDDAPACAYAASDDTGALQGEGWSLVALSTPSASPAPPPTRRMHRGQEPRPASREEGLGASLTPGIHILRCGTEHTGTQWGT
jgi:hypothetical protein